MVERDDARDDRALMDGAADAVAELQTERRHLVGKAEVLRLRPYAASLVGGDARLDQRDRVVEPFARAFVSVVLHARRAADVEGAVVAGAIAHERLQDVEERLV